MRTTLVIILLLSLGMACSRQDDYTLTLINKSSVTIYATELQFGTWKMGPVRISQPNTHRSDAFLTDPVPDEAQLRWETGDQDKYSGIPKELHKKVISVKSKIEKGKKVDEYIFTIKDNDEVTLEIKYRK